LFLETDEQKFCFGRV